MDFFSSNSVEFSANTYEKQICLNRFSDRRLVFRRKAIESVSVLNRISIQF